MEKCLICLEETSSKAIAMHRGESNFVEPEPLILAHQLKLPFQQRGDILCIKGQLL